MQLEIFPDLVEVDGLVPCIAIFLVIMLVAYLEKAVHIHAKAKRINIYNNDSFGITK